MKYDVVVIKDCLANYHVRLDGKATDLNSVTKEDDEHAFYRALIVNKHVRGGLENGSLTKGQLLALGEYFYPMGGNIERLGRILDKLKGISMVQLVRKVLGHQADPLADQLHKCFLVLTR